MQSRPEASSLRSYASCWPSPSSACRGQLGLRRRLQRKFGDFAGFWRMGIQKRGAWHFHLLLFVGPSFGVIGELRRFISSSWHDVTGKVSEGHLHAGTRIEAIRKWRQVTSYVERYMAKPEEF